MLCYRGNLLQSIRLYPFWERPPFVPMNMHNFTSFAKSFRVTCWMFTILLVIYFSFFQLCISSRDCLVATKSGSLTISSSWCDYHFWYYSLSFVFRVLEFLSPVVVPGLVVCIKCILPCKNSRLLHSCCVKWPFGYLMRWLPYSWTIVALQPIYVIKVVQLLFYFPD